MNTDTEPRIFLDSFSAEEYGNSYSFSGFAGIIAAATPEEVLPALEQINQAVQDGLHAAGFLSYEAAAALGQDLPAHQPGDFPLLWFALYRHRHRTTSGEKGMDTTSAYETSDWSPSITERAYRAQVDRIREYIAAGDAYQVNLTMQHSFRFTGDPLAYYRDICRVQRAPFCAFLNMGNFQILSASPELFFQLRHGTLTARPMKGTAPRGRWHAEDEGFREGLRKSRKDRAENLMIVDLLRNDMSKVSVTGSVRVPSMFDVEALETVHQMTSTVTSRFNPHLGMVELFRALFPCGSITGAPKKRAMEIIKEIEGQPRGLYTGCIGFISPKQEAMFSVAIRTIIIDSAAGTGRLGIGSGITWESTAGAEYKECLLKTEFAHRFRPEFQLVETLLYEGDIGYFLLERHMARLYRSAAYFGFTLRLGAVLDTLNLRAQSLRGKNKVRLLLSRNGTFSVRTEPLSSPPEEPVAFITLADQPVDSRDPFLYHKTTNRERYQLELKKHPQCADVIFRNERGEVTEGALHNIIVNLKGRMVTPPLAAGILPGTFREELLASQIVREKQVTVDDLRQAEDLFIINSVRKWRKARLLTEENG